MFRTLRSAFLFVSICIAHLFVCISFNSIQFDSILFTCLLIKLSFFQYLLHIMIAANSSATAKDVFAFRRFCIDQESVSFKSNISRLNLSRLTVLTIIFHISAVYYSFKYFTTYGALSLISWLSRWRMFPSSFSILDFMLLFVPIKRIDQYIVVAFLKRLRWLCCSFEMILAGRLDCLAGGSFIRYDVVGAFIRQRNICLIKISTKSKLENSSISCVVDGSLSLTCSGSHTHTHLKWMKWAQQ